MRHSFSALDLLLSVTKVTGLRVGRTVAVGLPVLLPRLVAKSRLGTSGAHISAPRSSTIIFTNS